MLRGKAMTNGEFKIELEKRTVGFSVAVLRLLRKIPVEVGELVRIFDKIRVTMRSKPIQ